MRENPFRFGEAIRGEYFANRKEEIRRLSLDLYSGQNVILYSPRRYGKTSLVLEVLDRLRKKDCLCVYIDLFPVSSKMKFARIVASALAKGTSRKVEEIGRVIREFLPSLIPKITFKGSKGWPDFDLEFGERKMDIDKLLSDLYDAPERIAKKRNKRVVVAFDEFQEIFNINGEEIEKEMRSKIQHHQDVAYVFLGSKRHMIERIFNDQSRPFYKIGKFFPLEKIPRDDFVKFIVKRFKHTGFSIPSNMAERIVEITDSHPYYTQILCYEVWNECLKGGRISETLVDKGLEGVLLDHSYAFTSLWDSLPSKQKNLLIALVFEENPSLHSQFLIEKYDLGSPATVSKSLKTLEIKGILERESHKPVFSDFFFKEWVRRRIG